MQKTQVSLFFVESPIYTLGYMTIYLLTYIVGHHVKNIINVHVCFKHYPWI